MLRIYEVVLDWLSSLRSVLDAVEQRDRNLADQLRRSSTSVCLNLAEGMGATGKTKLNCYRIALCEMREAIAAVEIASRLGYVAPIGERVVSQQKQIVGTLELAIVRGR